MADVDVLLLFTPFFQTFQKMDMKPLVIRNLYDKLNAEYLFGELRLDQPVIQVTDTGLLSIATYLERGGVGVRYFIPYPEVIPSVVPLITFSRYLNKLKGAIETMNPKIIGAGPYTNRYPSALAIFRFVKRFFPNIVTVLGGQHATFMDMQTLLDSKSIDIIVRGEGEKTMLQVVKALLRNRILRDVPGITYREEDGRIRRNPPTSPLKPSDIPILAYHLLPSWVKESKLILNVTTGRGCPNNCLYCTERNFWGMPRVRPAENVLEELKLVHEYNPLFVRFADDTFAWNPDFVSDLSRLVVKEGLSFQYLEIWTRVDQISDKRLDELGKMANKVKCCLGIESASPQVLRVMRKGITFDQSVKACKKITEHSAIPNAFWIVGHPGSNSQAEELSYEGQKHLMKQKLCMLHESSVFVPYPGSEPFYHPKQYGVEILSRDWSKFCENPHTFPPASCLKQLGPIEIFHHYVNHYLLNIQMLSEHLGYDWLDLSEKT